MVNNFKPLQPKMTPEPKRLQIEGLHILPSVKQQVRTSHKALLSQQTCSFITRQVQQKQLGKQQRQCMFSYCTVKIHSCNSSSQSSRSVGV